MYYRYALVAVLLFFLFIPFRLHAETRLDLTKNIDNAVWTKEGNPYILDGRIFLNAGKKLTIREGVVVMVASTTNPRYLTAHGTVEIFGTEAEPVHFIGLSQSGFRGKENRFEHVIFENSPIYIHTDAGLNAGTTSILNSKFFKSAVPLEINSGKVEIREGEISEGTIGLLSQDTAFGTSIVVRDSIFENNKTYNIRNEISKSVDARDNWWGSAGGPGVSISGAVLVAPWKTENPRPQKIACCSNVLFLPGLKASRLYRDDADLLGGGTTTRRAWEPYTNNDVRSLYLDEAGKSLNSTIHTKDILASAFGIVDIYKNFIAMMDGVVAEKTINEWKPFAYDWRLSPEDAVRLAVPEVERLASTSKTKKVSVVAHSNGGLVTKALGRELEKRGMSALLDKVVFVAVPELGTPQAAAGLLHGNDEALGGGIILRNGVARTWGRHMLGAYGLLPTAEYFKRMVEPVISFAGKAVGSHSDFVNFLTGVSDGRVIPKENDMKSPTVLSATLSSQTELLHARLDTWKFPTSTEVLSLVGWGTPTTQTIEYSSTSPRIRKNSDGDGTVVARSAAAYWDGVEGKTVYFNQHLFNRDLKKNISHATILEADAVQNFISKLVSTSTISAMKNLLPSYLSWGKPARVDEQGMSWITVSVHSPVEIDIYSSGGKHMGLVPAPGALDSDIMILENTIGGQYDAIGDEKYFTIPAHDTYDIRLKGTGVGNFTFQIQKFVGEDMTEVSNTIYADLPVTPLLVASTTLSSLSLTPELNLDVDGNGTTDMRTGPRAELDPILHLDAIKIIISSLGLDSSLQRKFVHRIEKIQDDLEKEKPDKIVEKIRNFSDHLAQEHWHAKKMSDPDRQALVSSFESLLSSLESD